MLTLWTICDFRLAAIKFSEGNKPQYLRRTEEEYGVDFSNFEPLPRPDGEIVPSDQEEVCSHCSIER